MSERTIERKEIKSLIPTITTAHAERIGWARAIAGGFSMYLSIPVWIVFHLTIATFLYQKIFRPLLGTPAVLWKNHVLLDRHRVEGLVTIDKLNCHFCAYANGLTTMMNMEIDYLATFQGTLSVWRYLALCLFGIISVPIILIGEIFAIQICYNLMVAPPLGLHRTSFFETQKWLKQNNYAEQYPPFSQSIIHLAKNVFLRFSLLLEQIESAWCPIHHLEQREGIVTPKHHHNFFRPHELDKMFQVISTEGTVSDRKPLY